MLCVSIKVLKVDLLYLIDSSNILTKYDKVVKRDQVGKPIIFLTM